MNQPTLFLLSALALSIASAARADSQRLQITTSSAVKGPDAQAIVHALLPAPSGAQRVEVRLANEPGKNTLLIEVSGTTLSPDAPAKLKAMFPALRDAQIELSSDAMPLPPLPPEPPALDTPEEIAAFRAKLQAQLAAEGKTGTVEVKVTNDGGKKEVRVEVHADDAK